MNNDFSWEDTRPSWDVVLMALCFTIAKRSIDPNTGHGCVVVDSSHSILTVGYNGPPRGIDDSKIPLNRPDGTNKSEKWNKYLILRHSEDNAITNAARSGVSLKDSVFYITGRPCVSCFGKIINVGASKIIYGPRGFQALDQEEEMFNFLKSQQRVQIEVFEGMREVIKLLSGLAQFCNIEFPP